MRYFAAASAFIIFLAVFFLYFSFRFQGFWQGPQIIIDFPEEGATIGNSHIAVRGRVYDAAKIELNGRPIYVDESGNFEEELILSAGLNIIELKADGRFGSKIKEQRMVVVN